jgi:hypothetical protein
VAALLAHLHHQDTARDGQKQLHKRIAANIRLVHSHHATEMPELLY